MAGLVSRVCPEGERGTCELCAAIAGLRMGGL